MRNGNGNWIECKRVNKESRGKLSNDELYKFVGPGKVWDGERKFVGSETYGNYFFHFPLSIPFPLLYLTNWPEDGK